MGEIIYQKLVRDIIPNIIEQDGQRAVTRVLGTTEYRRELLKKLVEEATELLHSDGSIEERADVAEVLRALDKQIGYTSDEIEAARVTKAEKRGGFDQKIFLEKAITND